MRFPLPFYYTPIGAGMQGVSKLFGIYIVFCRICWKIFLVFFVYLLKNFAFRVILYKIEDTQNMEVTKWQKF